MEPNVYYVDYIHIHVISIHAVDDIALIMRENTFNVGITTLSSAMSVLTATVTYS
jgi:hypothetical protein